MRHHFLGQHACSKARAEQAQAEADGPQNKQGGVYRCKRGLKEHSKTNQDVAYVVLKHPPLFHNSSEKKNGALTTHKAAVRTQQRYYRNRALFLHTTADAVASRATTPLSADRQPTKAGSGRLNQRHLRGATGHTKIYLVCVLPISTNYVYFVLFTMVHRNSTARVNTRRRTQKRPRRETRMNRVAFLQHRRVIVSRDTN